MSVEQKPMIAKCKDGKEVNIPECMKKHSKMIADYSRVKDNDFWPETNDDPEIMEVVNSYQINKKS